MKSYEIIVDIELKNKKNIYHGKFVVEFVPKDWGDGSGLSYRENVDLDDSFPFTKNKVITNFSKLPFEIQWSIKQEAIDLAQDKFYNRKTNSY